MWTERPLTDNLFFHLCGEMLYKACHPAVGAIITMAYQVRYEVCMAIAEEVATLLNAGCGTKKKGGGA